MKYLKLFETTSQYEAYTADTANFIKPNVSVCKDATTTVYYNPSEPEETRVVAKYNVTDTSTQTPLRTSYENNVFKSMEIDGVMLDGLVTGYRFDTIGVHTVKYELYDETKLGNNALVFNSSNLIEIIIPNSITSIGNSAFQNCNNLTSIVIPNSVTSIGSSAFQSCSGLISITIPDSVTNIGKQAFYCFGHDALKTLNYNAKCDINSSFRGVWTNLETVIIGDSTPSIGYQAFAGCTSLTSVIISNSVTSIGGSAFAGCASLTSIVCNATTAPTIESNVFLDIKTSGTLTVPSGSSGYDVWMGTGDYYLGKYNWTKVEQ